jgi:mannose-6-phosphate isomerase-like protein (cupin superfamily)
MKGGTVTHTLVHLEDVEDVAVRFELSPSMEARFPTRELALEHSGASFQRLAPGYRQPFAHRHREQEEVYVVVEGGGRMKIDDEIVDLRKHDFVRVPPEATRCLEGGPEGIAVVVFGAPRAADQRVSADSEQFPGWWS